MKYPKGFIHKTLVYTDEDGALIADICSKALIQVSKKKKGNIKTLNELIDIRNFDEFAEHAFYLKDEYDWVLLKDSQDFLCLVPLVKKEEDE